MSQFAYSTGHKDNLLRTDGSVDTSSLIVQSSTTQKPLVEIKNTNVDSTGPTLKLNNASGTAAGSDNDVCGTIAFNANDDQGTADNQSFATIIGTAIDTATTSEKGKIEIGVACTDDGGVDTILTIEGGANAVGSTTTIAGTTLIGTSTNAWNSRLYVDGNAGSLAWHGYYFIYPGAGYGVWNYLGPAYSYSIGCSDGIKGQFLIIPSDTRLKKDFKEINSLDSYNIINQIKIYKYKLKKELDHGPEYLGVKAQEIETIYPEGVSQSTDYLPSIMEQVVYNNKKFTLTSIGDVVVGDKLKIYYQDKTRNNIETSLIANVVNVIGNEVEIDTEIKDDDDEIYIYGKKYDDVREMDYNRLNLLSISAIQKLIEDKTALEAKVANLESDIATIKAHIGL